MGYCMSCNRTNFKIFNLRKELAHKAILELMGKTDDFGHGLYVNGRDTTKTFSWVYTDSVLKSKNLEEALKAWRWEVDLDEDLNIININFIGEKLGDDINLFEAIAPFVEDGSYIEMSGEDGDIWRWVFEDGKCIEKNAIITFE